MQIFFYSHQLIITLLILATALGTITALAIKERRPRESLDPSLVPTMPLMLFSGLVAILALVHLINLFGVKTG